MLTRYLARERVRDNRAFEDAQRDYRDAAGRREAAQRCPPLGRSCWPSERLLPTIVADLKQTLPDPYSIRDLVVCPATHVSLRDGAPFSWAVDLALNAKGASGGYAGLTAYGIGFKQGRVTVHAFADRMAGNGAFDAMINRTILKRFRTCQAIPDATVQALLAKPITNGG